MNGRVAVVTPSSTFTDRSIQSCSISSFMLSISLALDLQSEQFLQLTHLYSISLPAVSKLSNNFIFLVSITSLDPVPSLSYMIP